MSTKPSVVPLQKFLFNKNAGLSTKYLKTVLDLIQCAFFWSHRGLIETCSSIIESHLVEKVDILLPYYSHYFSDKDLHSYI